MREIFLIFIIIFSANLAFSQENKGDNELLEVIKNFFISNGFEIIPPTYLLNDNLFNKDEFFCKKSLTFIKYGPQIINICSRGAPRCLQRESSTYVCIC